MKKTRLLGFTALFTSIILLFAACSKQGVLGPQGVPGEQGETGVAGPSGKDGAVILAGDQAPVADSGKPGDFYIDTSALVLYGPKKEAGWGDGISMKGTSKTAFMHGNGQPSVTEGGDGDYYFDELSGVLYGPKSTSGWGDGFLLHGAQGPAGVPGPVGNGNVKAYTFTKDLDWDFYGNSVYQITKHLDAIDSVNLLQGALLAYVQLSDGFWYQAPFWFNSRNYYYNYAKGVFTIYSPDPGTAIQPESVIEIKLIIMQGTSLQAVGDAPRSRFTDYLRVARVLHQGG